MSLAEALQRLGHSILVVALNDRWLSGQTDAVSEMRVAGVAVERFSSCMPWGQRIDRVRTQLKDFHPEWVSFQLVNYGYHPKGLLFGFNRHLMRLVASCENWQIMFQELWIGIERGAPWKHQLVGVLQRHSIKRLVYTLRPKLIQTSTPFFRAVLSSVGLEASVLPLAGSIPVNSDPGSEWFLQTLNKEGISIATDTRQKYLIGGFFGSIYGDWEPEPFFSTLRAVGRMTGRQICILSAGRLANGEGIWERLPADYSDFHFVKLGGLTSDLVSQYFQNLDFGIAASPWKLIGKSSATAAMLDHGLPVMVTRNDVQSIRSKENDSPADPLLILADRDVSEQFLSGLPRRTPRHSVEELAMEFVRKIQSIQSGEPSLVTENRI